MLIKLLLSSKWLVFVYLLSTYLLRFSVRVVNLHSWFFFLIVHPYELKWIPLRRNFFSIRCFAAWHPISGRNFCCVHLFWLDYMFCSLSCKSSLISALFQFWPSSLFKHANWIASCGTTLLRKSENFSLGLNSPPRKLT